MEGGGRTRPDYPIGVRGGSAADPLVHPGAGGRCAPARRAIVTALHDASSPFTPPHGVSRATVGARQPKPPPARMAREGHRGLSQKGLRTHTHTHTHFCGQLRLRATSSRYMRSQEGG